MTEKYYQIQSDLREANKSGDLKKIKRLRNKLTKWQIAYGAYAPITQENCHKYD